MAESTAFGVACLAGLGSGIYGSVNDIARLWQADLRCDPQLDADTREREVAGWRNALNRVRSG